MTIQKKILGVLAIAFCGYHTAASEQRIRGKTVSTDQVDVEQRLLWRNATPIDDDDGIPGEERTKRMFGALRPGILGGNVGSKQNNDNSLFNKGPGGRPGLISNALGKDEGDEGDEIDSVNQIEMEVADETEDDEEITELGSLLVGPSKEVDQDCLWRVLTGTSCTSIIFGNIVEGIQHEHLVADGECRYNDFLGYYRAGCQRAISGNPDLPAAQAKVVLTEAFCSDPECSSDCDSESVIHANSLYLTNFCYLTNFYEQETEGKGDADGNVTASSRAYSFSFEFVGGCLETENCNVVEELDRHQVPLEAAVDETEEPTEEPTTKETEESTTKETEEPTTEEPTMSETTSYPTKKAKATPSPTRYPTVSPTGNPTRKNAKNYYDY